MSKLYVHAKNEDDHPDFCQLYVWVNTRIKYWGRRSIEDCRSCLGKQARMESSGRSVPDAHLEKFARAKKEQQLLYDVTGDLISRIQNELHEMSSVQGIDSCAVQMRVDHLGERIESLKSDLSRKKMKIAFFGGTSSGKTTTLNAMIGQELLPSGMGDTTSCFVQIEKMTNDSICENSSIEISPAKEHTEGCSIEKKKDQSYFIVREVENREKEASLDSFLENRQPLTIKALTKLCDVKSGSSLDSTYLVEIHLSEDDIKNDHLLNYDLQIMDCPGITKCRELGDRVKTFCKDSDVHLFIVNPKTVMSPEEREHFVEVGKRLSKPDIIVGFTQWDLSARERHPEEVKARHVDSVFELLKELDVVSTRMEAEERCFFYSGTEALDLALNEKGFLTRGWEERFKTFQNFMSKIEERVTTAGITAKLSMNRENCQEVSDQCVECLSLIEGNILSKTSELSKEVEALTIQLQSYNEKMDEFMQEREKLRKNALQTIDESIFRCMTEVSEKMSQTLKRNSDSEDFEEDNVHQFAENAILLWYRRILNEFHRATNHVCEGYSFDVRESYLKHMTNFPHNTPGTYLENQDENEQSTSSILGSPIPKAAVKRVLSEITVRPVWTSFATTRRRLSSVETDAERNVIIRGMAATTGVFFMHVRRWIRASIEQKLQKLTALQKDSLICPHVRQNCHELVEEFCDNTDEYYMKTCVQEIRDSLQTRREKLEEKLSTLMKHSESFSKLKIEADQMQKCPGMSITD
ncbi:transmembrane GTPase Marf-like [Lytechinus variegatus]|uniref:transmembrane GTPase Marf-like n=1 Tax=Lytechinus variegatus TaxID=7654 RepID=UPI001BB1BF75|nr:transmembrane GTPase Marf-like [Lytechinus variegatus]